MTSYRNITDMLSSDALDNRSYFPEGHSDCELSTILIPSIIFMLIFAMFFHIGYSFEVHKSNFSFFVNKVLFFSKSAFPKVVLSINYPCISITII